MKKINKIKVFSFFSGVGGLDSVFIKDSNNFDFIGFSENNKWAEAILKYNHKYIPNWGDIEKLSGNKVLPKFDMLIAGFSCKGFSLQGKQEGLKNVKSNLFKHIPKILKKCKPKYVLLENVPGLLTKKMENDFGKIKNDIENEGYRFSYRLQDSSYYKTPQQRIRVFMLCIRKDIKPFGESDSFYEVQKRCKVKKGKIEYISYSKSTRHKHIDYRIRTDDLINTLTTGIGCKGASTGTMVVSNNKHVRNLSVAECEKLMTWNKDFTKYGIIDDIKIQISKTNRYMAIGNGVVSSCVEPFRKHILALDEIN